eukprot:290176-Hanusia_phi.AAC.1
MPNLKKRLRPAGSDSETGHGFNRGRPSTPGKTANCPIRCPTTDPNRDPRRGHWHRPICHPARPPRARTRTSEVGGAAPLAAGHWPASSKTNLHAAPGRADPKLRNRDSN